MIYEQNATAVLHDGVWMAEIEGEHHSLDTLHDDDEMSARVALLLLMRHLSHMKTKSIDERLQELLA